MKTISTHDLLATNDCSFPSCPNEAERGADRCTRHLRSELPGPIDPSSFEEDEPTVTPPSDRPCKTEDCPNLANTRYDRGPYAGLCEELCIPAKRDKISTDAIARRAGTLAQPEAPPPAEPPDPEPPLPLVPSDPVGDHPSFADVAEEVEAAFDDRQLAEGRYQAAVERLRKHPVWEATLDYIDGL